MLDSVDFLLVVALFGVFLLCHAWQKRILQAEHATECRNCSSPLPATIRFVRFDDPESPLAREYLESCEVCDAARDGTLAELEARRDWDENN